MKLAFLIRLAEAIVSSNDPNAYAVRKDSKELLEWCASKGTVFLHTHFPERSNAPETLLDITRILLKANYGGPWRIWNGDQQVRNEAVRKSKESLGFLQRQVPLDGLIADRISGYAALAEEGYKIVHIGTDLSDIEKQQLSGLGGIFIQTPPLPKPETHMIEPVWGDEYLSGYIVKSPDGAKRIFEPTGFEAEMRKAKSKVFTTHVAKHGQAILNRHIGDLDQGILNQIIVAVVKECGEGVARDSMMKSDRIEKRTGEAIDYWAGNLASRKAETED